MATHKKIAELSLGDLQNADEFPQAQPARGTVAAMIFSPAIALMNRLDVIRKFMLLGLMSLISIVVMIHSLVTSLNLVIQTSQRELEGIALIKPFPRTIQLIQQHRGLSAGLLGGDKTLSDRRAAKAKETYETFKAMEENLPLSLASSKDLQRIKANWERLRKDGLNWTKNENFTAHTRLIDQIQVFEVVAADEYALTLDPEIDTYYLIDSAIQHLPNVIERLDRIRGYGTGILAEKQATAQQKVEINTMIAELGGALNDLKDNLEKTGLHNPAMRDSISVVSNKISDSAQQIIALVASDIIADHFTTRPGDFLEMSTVAINKGYAQLYESLLPMSEDLLKARIARTENELLTSVGIAFMLFLVVVYFSVGICYAIIVNIQSLARSAHAFAGGDLRERINLDTRDELSQVGDSFNEMADGFSTLLEARREDDERLHVTIETSMDAVVQMNADGIIIGWNSQAEKIFGWSREAAIGQELRETIIPPSYREAHAQGMERFMLSGEGPALNSRIEIVGLHRDGHEFPIELSIAPIRMAGKIEFSAFIRDITERKANETRIQRLTQLYAALSQCNQAIVHCTSEAELLPKICHDVVQFGGVKMAWIGLVDKASQRVNPVASYGEGVAYLDDINILLNCNDHGGCGLAATAIREGHICWIQDFLNDPLTVLRHESGVRFGWGAAASLPLYRNGVVVGAFSLYSAEVNAFDEDARELLVEMAIDISFALDNFANEARRERAENEARLLTQRLTLATDAATVGIWDWHLKTDQWYGSPTYFTMLGYEPEEGFADQHAWLERIHPEDRDVVEEKIRAALAGSDAPYQYEARVCHADGYYRWINVIGRVAERDENGNAIRMLGVRMDITEHKQVKEEIEFKNTILLTQQETSLDAILVVDESSRIISYNQQFIDLWRLPQQMVSARLDAPVFQSCVEQVENTEVFVARIQYLYKHRDEKSREEIQLKDGRIIDRYSAPIKGADGKYYGRIWYFRNITQRKQAEEQLRESETRYKRIAEGLTDYQYTVRVENGRVVNTQQSTGCVTVTGYTAEEFSAISDLWIQIVVPEERDRVREYAQQILEGKEILPIEYRIIHKAGDTRWVSDTTILFKDSSGNLRSYDGVIKDITERKAAEEQILRYVEQLEGAFMRTVAVASTLTEMRDPYTAGHERRVAELAAAIGSELGLDARRIEGLRVAGQLHDIGKISIPTEILAKPGKITAAEYMLIKDHAKAGYDALKDVGFPWPVAEVARQHHERMNGSGYPRGLKGDEILLEARIMSVADVVEAMASHRPYRPGLGIDMALAEIERGSGSAYDAAVAGACLRLFREQGYALPS